MTEPITFTFDRYCISLGESPPQEYNASLAAEVRERLQQIEYILSRIEEIEAAHEKDQNSFRVAMSRMGQAHAAASGPGPSPAPKEMDDAFMSMIKKSGEASLELRVLTEAFYYFAARVRTILRHSDKPLPHLSTFECTGVRNVRNHLIEHPEGNSSRIFSQSFSFGAPNGPHLKPSRVPGEPDAFPDAGLRVNAREFTENLREALLKAISRA